MLKKWMNLELIIQSKVSHKEKNKFHVLCNLERRYWWTYLQGSNREVEIKDRLSDTVGEGEVGMNGKSSTETHTLLHVK